MYMFKDGKKVPVTGHAMTLPPPLRPHGGDIERFDPVEMRNQIANRLLTAGTGSIGPGGEQQRKPWYKHWYIILIIVLVLVAIAGGLIYFSHRSRMNKTKTTKPAFGYYF